jgi:hypothetical protein
MNPANQTWTFEWLSTREFDQGQQCPRPDERQCLQKLKGLILAQNERWRRGLGMQVEREPRKGGQRRKGQ